MAKVTIFDVAKHAGVSPATVSRVMNNGVCSEKAKIKVINAINDLDFVPNQSARNLGSVNNSKRIAIIIPNSTHFVYMEMIDGIKNITKIYGFDYTLYTISSIDEYHKLCKELSKSTEYLAIIEIANYKPIKDKKVINLFDSLFNVKLVSPAFKKPIYIDMGDDKVLSKYLSHNLFKRAKITTNKHNSEILITDSIERACHWLNQGYQGTIYTLENCLETGKLLPIKPLHIDFYSIGVILVRHAMKVLLQQEQQQTICIDI